MLTTQVTPMTISAKSRSLHWVSARHLQHILARGQAAGLSMDNWLSEAGLGAAEVSDAEAIVPISAIEILLATLNRHRPVPLIGLHLASDIQPATLGPLGHIAQACTTFRDVLNMAVHFNGLLSNIGQLSVQHHPGNTEVIWRCDAGGPAFQREATEYVMGAITVLGRFLMPEQRHMLASVNFPHPRPDDAGHTRGYFTFFRCPVYFDQPAPSLVIPSHILDVRMHHGDAVMKDLLEHHAERTLKEREQVNCLSDEVRHLIRSMIADGIPTKEMVAQQLGMSARSLQRRLDELGSSYRQLLHAVRMGLAESQLTSTSDSMDAIASRLGFASRQAFLRWFKQSRGQTPSQYRHTPKEQLT